MGSLRPALGFAIAALALTGSAFAQSPAETKKPGGGAEGRPAQPETPARTPLPNVPPAPSPAWQRHVEIGGDLAFVARPSRPDSGDPGQRGVAYEPTIGFGIHASWQIHRYVAFRGYFVDARHDVTLPKGALGLRGTVTMPAVYTYAFGARLAPTLPLGDRARTWASAGIGWGRFEFDRMTVKEDGRAEYQVRERADAFIEYPIGVGTSFDILKGVPNIMVSFEVTGAFVSPEEGAAVEHAQAIDSYGRKIRVGGFPHVTSSFVQTIGLSLVF